MSRRFDRCEACGAIVGARTRTRTLKGWSEGAKTCFYCGLVDSLLHDAKKKHGIDPSGGGRYEVVLSANDDLQERYYLTVYTGTRDYVTDERITAKIYFYNPISESGSFSLSTFHVS